MPSCASSCSTLPTYVVCVCVVIVPTRFRDCSVHPTCSVRFDGCPPSRSSASAGRCLVRVSKDRPSTVLGAEESTARVDVAASASESGSQPDSCSAFVVLHHLDGFLLLDPARVFHRTSSHGVRDVSSPRQRIPTTHSYPSKPCSPSAADTAWIAPPDAGPASPFQVSLVGSPRALPPRPWPFA